MRMPLADSAGRTMSPLLILFDFFGELVEDGARCVAQPGGLHSWMYRFLECGWIDADEIRAKEVAAIDQLRSVVELLVTDPTHFQMLLADRRRQLSDRDIEGLRRPPEAFLQSAQPLAGKRLIAKSARLGGSLEPHQPGLHVADELLVHCQLFGASMGGPTATFDRIVESSEISA